MNIKIIIEINNNVSVINCEVNNRLYPIATICNTEDKVGKVTIDDRTNIERIISIGETLRCTGLLILNSCNKLSLTQNKPQDK